MKTALRHPAAGMDRLCRRSCSPDGPTDSPTGRRAFLAIPILIPLVMPSVIPLPAAASGPAPAGLRPVERAGWILDVSDR
jgi:hypothetical protein